MKTRRLFLQLAILATGGLLSTQTVAAKSCLWKVTSGDQTLYLQGSIHLLKSSNYPLAPAIETAYSNSNVIVFEADINEMQSPETQQMILQKALLTPPASLKNELSEAVYDDFMAACKAAGIQPFMVNQTKPWMASMTLTLTKIFKMGFNPAQGLEYYFNGKAKKEGKKIVGLESVAFQIELLNSLAELNADDFIKRTLADLETIETEMDELVNAWSKGDIDALGGLINKSFGEYPQMRKKFVDERNRQWVKSIKQYLQQPETHMVIVGAGHLPGEAGLVDLLKKEGFSVEQH